MKKHFLLGVFFVLALAPVFAFAATPGETVAFNVDPVYDSKGRTSVTATLRVEGENAHYYVEDEYWQALAVKQVDFLSTLQTLAKEFDARIYPLEHQAFGLEPTPGIDNDPKVVVLMAPLISDAGGYFLLGNGVAKARHAQSNEREMVYINADLAKASRWQEFLAHELQHLITFGAKELRLGKNEEVWLNELRSEYAPTLLGYDDRTGVTNLTLRANSFLREPGDALVNWQNKNADYGLANLFGQYLVETYGTKFLRETIDAGGSGIAAIEEVLKARGLAQTFSEVYAGWLRTLFLGGYRHPALQNLRLVPPTLYNLFGSFSVNTTGALESWSIASLGVQVSEPGLEIQIASEPSESWLLAILKKNNPAEPILTYQFTGSRTVQVGLASASDQNLVVVPVNITDRAAPKENAPRAAPYTLGIRTLREAPLATPSPSPAPIAIPVPSPTPVALVSPLPSPTPLPPDAVSFPDGTLIRVKGDTRVWIVNGAFLRHISHPAIFGMYQHLKWENVVEVEPGTAAQFRVSALLRAAGDAKVYEIDAAGVKRWLNVTPAAFLLSGRDWAGVYEVNTQERDFYRTGETISF